MRSSDLTKDSKGVGRDGVVPWGGKAGGGGSNGDCQDKCDSPELQRIPIDSGGMGFSHGEENLEGGVPKERESVDEVTSDDKGVRWIREEKGSHMGKKTERRGIQKIGRASFRDRV